MWVAASAIAIIVGIAGGLLFARDATLVAIPGDRYVLLLVVAMLVLVGAAVTAVRRPPDRGAQVGAATFTIVSLALGGALAGYLLAPAHRTIDSEHVIATASAGVHATFDGSAVVGGDAGAGECHSRPGSKEVGEIVTDELGATSAGPLHAGALARQAGMSRVVVPAHSGAFSALGCLGLLVLLLAGRRRLAAARVLEREERPLDEVVARGGDRDRARRRRDQHRDERERRRAAGQVLDQELVEQRLVPEEDAVGDEPEPRHHRMAEEARDRARGGLRVGPDPEDPRQRDERADRDVEHVLGEVGLDRAGRHEAARERDDEADEREAGGGAGNARSAGCRRRDRRALR